uniref:Tc1-like transposase DDE domain-containing protein n=1 Tax=Amphiprion percula TaxID=161767 RepID=A0A3P8TDT5_AMPPE
MVKANILKGPSPPTLAQLEMPGFAPLQLSQRQPSTYTQQHLKTETAGLPVLILRQKPLLTKKNIKTRLTSANKHLNDPQDFWENILWTAETKVELFERCVSCYILNIIAIVKHGGGSVMKILKETRTSTPVSRLLNGSKQNKMKVLEWPSQSLDLNPAEMLWQNLKKPVHAGKPSSVAELTQFCKEEWTKISPQRCERLIASYRKRLISVVAAEGGPTSY